MCGKLLAQLVGRATAGVLHGVGHDNRFDQGQQPKQVYHRPHGPQDRHRPTEDAAVMAREVRLARQHVPTLGDYGAARHHDFKARWSRGQNVHVQQPQQAPVGDEATRWEDPAGGRCAHAQIRRHLAPDVRPDEDALPRASCESGLQPSAAAQVREELSTGQHLHAESVSRGPVRRRGRSQAPVLRTGPSIMG